MLQHAATKLVSDDHARTILSRCVKGFLYTPLPPLDTLPPPSHALLPHFLPPPQAMPSCPHPMSHPRLPLFPPLPPLPPPLGWASVLVVFC